MINFNQLRAFWEVARKNSFSKAAQSLFVTQPAVSSQVRSLEEATGLKLFRKRGRQVVLTESGAELFQYAHRLFELEREMEAVVAQMHKLERGVLKVCTTKTYARYLMPSIMTRFHAAHPGIKIVLEEGSSLEMCRSLLELRNELGVLAKVAETKRIQFIPFRSERIVLFTSPRHPFASREAIRFCDLEGQPVIMKEKGSGTHALVTQCFARHGMVPNVLVETSNVDFIKDMVSKGEGISFLVEQAVREDVRRGLVSTVALLDQEMELPVFIAVREADKLSPSAKAFLDILLYIREEKTSGNSMGSSPEG